MAWAALIPLAAQLLKGDEKEDEKPAGAQLPPPPSIGEVFAKNQAAHNAPARYSSPIHSNPFSQFPIGGNKGPNG